MCGIAGIVKKQGNILESELKAICNILEQRGPDEEGYFIEEGVGLGHRRLSIIDLESGSQPMFSLDENIVVVFNGEIYNFIQIREELVRKGFSFRTHSDTEVLIVAYQAYGLNGLLSEIEGMFAFALFDKSKDKIFLVRDRFGEKPLYYCASEEHFLFASELKAIEGQLPSKEIDLEAMNLFLSLTYIPAPFTIYKGVKKLEAGHYISLQSNGTFNLHKYYDLLENLKGKSPITDFKAAKEQLKDLLYKSVKQRMVADVQIGAFLSGGIDSSIITAIMAELSDKPINTFSIGFLEKEYDESKRAKQVADKVKSNHTVHFLDYKDVISLVDDIILNYDEPFGDSSALPSFYVAKLAREHVTVVLTGDCADELFGGYEKYLGQWYAKKIKGLPKVLSSTLKALINRLPHTRFTNSILRRAKKVINNADLSSFDLHYSYMCLGFSDAERLSLLGRDNFQDVKAGIEKVYGSYNEGTDLEKGFYTDLKVVLEGDMLAKVDRICMQNSLEARVPFLDSKIVETAYRMPVGFKIKGKEKKRILKETFKYLLPEETVSYRKKGFGVPVDYWFKNQLRPELEELLNKNFIEKQGLFNYPVVEKLLQEHMSGKENHKGKLWNLFVFQKWYMSKIQ